MGNNCSSSRGDVGETSIACLSGHCIGLKATKSGHDIERRVPKAELRKHNPRLQINERSLSREQLLGVAKHLGYAPDYFFTVDGNPTNLKVSQGYLMDSTFVVSVDNKKVKVHRLKDCDVPRNADGLDLEKIRDDAGRGYYGWNMGSGTISFTSEASSSSTSSKRRGK